MIGEKNGEASRGEKRKEKLREEVGGANVRE